MQSDLETIRRRAIEAIEASALAVRIQDVALESDRDDEGGEFLRVMVQMGQGTAPRDEDLRRLIAVLEDAIWEIDERYPSVRFLDAA